MKFKHNQKMKIEWHEWLLAIFWLATAIVSIWIITKITSLCGYLFFGR